MTQSYATYEAKARFSEILRKVRAGQTIRITYHGKEIAEVVPLAHTHSILDARLQHLEQSGELTPASGAWSPSSTAVERPGVLDRFLEERE